ncbi:PREDICTED: serine protease inhibitor dipetalogastin-like [Nicrophorus vespilloides]|uniref:Serine protease inhibitor dipetalogastin-like n=1 Tax=Nicrophorus vespilloides TaxID=110193 RepID=A0ABM1N6Z7_NICVS|nr:PREDICTED: serine protease inhibitor dipetalogastin-like [Nicrophorus vespilloides]
MKTIAILISVVAAAVALEPCVCTFDYRPVCGSDGRTYGNLCGLKCEQRTDSTLTLAYHGECKAVVEKRSEELCFCTDDLRPVCGTDAVTYDNQCLLGCARRTDASIYVLYEGVCKKNQEPICISTCNIQNWMSERGLTLAPEKTEAVLLIGRRKAKPLKYSISGTEITPKKVIKYLGVFIDSSLTYAEHIRAVAILQL